MPRRIRCNKHRSSKLRPKCKKKRNTKYPAYIFPEVQYFPDSDVANALASIGSLESVKSSIDSFMIMLETSNVDKSRALDLIRKFIKSDVTLNYYISEEDIVKKWKLWVQEAEERTRKSTSTLTIGNFTNISQILSDLCLAKYIRIDLQESVSVEFGVEDSKIVKEIVEKKLLGSKIDPVEILHLLSIV